MRSFLAVLFFLCAFIAPLPPVYAADADLWLYRESPEPVPEALASLWARSAMQGDEHWAIFNFPERPPTQEESHAVWITTHLSNLVTDERNTIFFSTTGESVRVWLDDEVLASSGAMGPTFSGGGWRWHYLTLPPGAADKQLTIECYSPFPHEVGRLHNFRVDTPEANAARIFLLDATFIITLPVALAMLIVVSFFYRKEKTDRRIYRALMAFLSVFALWAFSGLQSKFFLMPGAVFWWYMLTLAAYLLPVTANAIIYEVIDGKGKVLTLWVIRGYLLLMFSAVVAECLGWHGLKNLMPLYYVFIAIYEPVVFYWTFRAAKKGSRYAKAALVPIAMFAVLGVFDGINAYWHILPISIYFSPLGIFGLAAFLLAMLHDFVVREQQLGRQADTLTSDIAKAQEHEAYDTLTHCLTRAMLAPLLTGAIRDARVKQRPFSLLMFDIDHFKGFNDTYGHEAGDEVLAGFAAAIRHDLADSQPFLRWGGEEFVVILPDCSLEEARSIADRLRRRISGLSLHAQQITTSVGVATWHGTSDTQEHLFERVDAALYRAKEGGRNRVEVEA